MVKCYYMVFQFVMFTNMFKCFTEWFLYCISLVADMRILITYYNCFSYTVKLWPYTYLFKIYHFSESSVPVNDYAENDMPAEKQGGIKRISLMATMNIYLIGNDNSLMNTNWHKRFIIRKHYIPRDIEFIPYNSFVYYYIKYTN